MKTYVGNNAEYLAAAYTFAAAASKALLSALEAFEAEGMKTPSSSLAIRAICKSWPKINP